MEKMWATLVHLTMNMWDAKDNYIYWDDRSWDHLINICQTHRINTIVLDIGDGLQYKSHPEIAVEGAWTHERMRQEIAKCKAKGITILPKLNFSASHDDWLGEYHRMLSTSVYHKVCQDLICEVSELFAYPKYFHLGMDEEDHKQVAAEELVICRQNDLLFQDMRFLCDCVKSNGATPWVWHDTLFFTPDKFRQYFSPDEIIVSPWHYYAFREDHLTPITKYDFIYEYYTSGEFADMNLRYVEEDPFFVTFREQVIPNAQYGYKYVPCASNVFKCEWNHQDLVEFFKENLPEESVLGYMTAPWFALPSEKLSAYEESVKSLDEARRLFFPAD